MHGMFCSMSTVLPSYRCPLVSLHRYLRFAWYPQAEWCVFNLLRIEHLDRVREKVLLLDENKNISSGGVFPAMFVVQC